MESVNGRKLLEQWWARQNSNLRPLPCQGRTGPLASTRQPLSRSFLEIRYRQPSTSGGAASTSFRQVGYDRPAMSEQKREVERLVATVYGGGE